MALLVDAQQKGVCSQFLRILKQMILGRNTLADSDNQFRADWGSDVPLRVIRRSRQVLT